MFLYVRWLYMLENKRDTDVKNRLLDSVGEEEGGTIWETNVETCILPYVKKITNPSSMHETRHSKPVHWDNLEGWDGEEDRRGFRMGDMYNRGWFMSVYGKNHYNIVK